MSKRILVPLDQTAEAERIVPVIADTARGAGATVRLLHVAAVPEAIVHHGRVIAYADQETSRLEAEARDYLSVIELAFTGVPVEVAVRYGDPVTAILEEAEEFGADLIAVTTGSRRAFRPIGRVADQLLKRAPMPVMTYRAR
ncbi:MAG: universal stress protein [Candidatus Rokubacteria bacterium]|nr:universal stress protein [Candidatus Rokubacteria bacterium]